jgi:O-antigen/teichoic acid export membrane protein
MSNPDPAHLQQGLDMLEADREAQRQQFRRGQYLAFALAIALIAAGTVCILNGHDWAGAAIVTGTIASVILAFAYGRRARGAAPDERGE